MGAARSEFSGLHTAFASGWAAPQARSGGVLPFAPGEFAPVEQQQTAPSNAPLSNWSRSIQKRAWDIACVLAAMPFALPLFLAITLAVRATSRGPVLFRQQRMGRGGSSFTVLKFRTMPQPATGTQRTGLTTTHNQAFTPIGPFLRRWKLDELPQLLNILRGEMSLVGPRPKLPCYEDAPLESRPGLTGFATMVFAREEMAMAQLPNAQVEAYYQSVVKPFKQRLDLQYMERATFFSDLELILRSIFRAWNNVALTNLPPWIPQMHGIQPSPHIPTEIPTMPSPESQA